MKALRKVWQRIPLGILLSVLLMSALAGYALWHRVHPKPPVATFGIITPDGMSTSDPALSVWLDAAHEAVPDYEAAAVPLAFALATALIRRNAGRLEIRAADDGATIIMVTIPRADVVAER